jgi:hypothetical protein
MHTELGSVDMGLAPDPIQVQLQVYNASGRPPMVP